MQQIIIIVGSRSSIPQNDGTLQLYVNKKRSLFKLMSDPGNRNGVCCEAKYLYQQINTTKYNIYNIY